MLKMLIILNDNVLFLSGNHARTMFSKVFINFEIIVIQQ